jgi:formylmethanofuran dehydrogenase subunit E
VRIVAKEESRQKAKDCFPETKDKYGAQIEAYKIMNDEELFDRIEVSVNIRPEDMPGRPLRRVRCDECAEHVQDMREVLRNGKTLCRPCAGESYYLPIGVNKCEDRYAKKS